MDKGAVRFQSLHVFCFGVITFLFSALSVAQTSLYIDDSNSPYYFTSDYEVDQGDTLVFGPGARIYIGDSINITIRGYFRSVGSLSDSVLITAINPGIGWGIFDVKNTADSLVMKYTTVEEGAIYVDASPVQLSYTHFVNHQDFLWDDLILRIWYSTVDVNHCTFTGINKGEGILCIQCDDPQFTHNSFINTPDAIEMIDCVSGRINNCIFQNMKDDAIDLNHCSNVLIDSNQIYNVGNRGMEIGSESFGSCNDITLFRNIVVGCPEGINFKEGSGGTLVNNTLHGNQVGLKTLSDVGNAPVVVEVTNCIFSENIKSIFQSDNSNVSVSYSCFTDWGKAGTGNFVSNPKLENPDNRDFTPTIASPCIDNGNPDLFSDPDESRADIGAIHRVAGKPDLYQEGIMVWANAETHNIYCQLTQSYDNVRISDASGKILVEATILGENFFQWNLNTSSSQVLVINFTRKDKSVSRCILML